MSNNEALAIAAEMLALPGAISASNVAVSAGPNWGLLFVQADGSTRLHPCAPAKLRSPASIASTAAYWAFLSQVAELIREHILPPELYPGLQRT